MEASRATYTLINLLNQRRRKKRSESDTYLFLAHPLVLAPLLPVSIRQEIVLRLAIFPRIPLGLETICAAIRPGECSHEDCQWSLCDRIRWQRTQNLWMFLGLRLRTVPTKCIASKTFGHTRQSPAGGGSDCISCTAIVRWTVRRLNAVQVWKTRTQLLTVRPCDQCRYLSQLFYPIDSAPAPS